MVPIFNSVIKTVTRMNSWDAPEHWRKQHEDYHVRHNDRDSEDNPARRRLGWRLFL